MLTLLTNIDIIRHMKEDHIFIFAGNANEARDWMRLNSGKYFDAIYISHYSKILGLRRGLKYVRLLGWFTHPQAKLINQYLYIKDAINVTSEYAPA